MICVCGCVCVSHKCLRVCEIHFYPWHLTEVEYRTEFHVFVFFLTFIFFAKKKMCSDSPQRRAESQIEIVFGSAQMLFWL